MRGFMNGRPVTLPPEVPNLHVNRPNRSIMFKHFFSFSENMKIPLKQFTKLSDKSHVLKLKIFRRYLFFTSSIKYSYLQVSRCS